MMQRLTKIQAADRTPAEKLFAEFYFAAEDRI
jgi:hypothetical protein